MVRLPSPEGPLSPSPLSASTFPERHAPSDVAKTHATAKQHAQRPDGHLDALLGGQATKHERTARTRLLLVCMRRARRIETAELGGSETIPDRRCAGGGGHHVRLQARQHEGAREPYRCRKQETRRSAVNQVP